MSNTTTRALRLLSLLQTHRDWSSTELAGRLEVSQRTIRRDIDRLRELGYPVVATTGVTGGYRLQGGASLPPLVLDDDEAVAIAVGLGTAASGTVAGIQETSVRALAKLEQVLPPRLRQQVNALQTYTEPIITALSTVSPQILTLISQACRDGRRLRFDYHTRDQTPSARLVDPHRLVAAGRRWYLLGWDVDKSDWRTFRVDRLSDPVDTGVRVPPREPPDGNAAAFVQRSITGRMTQYRAVVTMHADRRTIVERIHTTAGYTLEELGPDRCLMRTEADSLEWLTLSIGSLGLEFEVHEPPELVAFVETMAQRLARSITTTAPGTAR